MAFKKDLKKSYLEKLKDPRWQKKRLEILERDGWRCRVCECKDRTLHVHHILYLPNKKPWEYENDYLITLCERCHDVERVSMEDLHKGFVKLIEKLYEYKYKADIIQQFIWRKEFLEMETKAEKLTKKENDHYRALKKKILVAEKEFRKIEEEDN